MYCLHFGSGTGSALLPATLSVSSAHTSDPTNTHPRTHPRIQPILIAPHASDDQPSAGSIKVTLHSEKLANPF